MPMHVALLANTAWLDEELGSMKHLVVGLLDEAVRVTHVLPAGRAEGEEIAFGRRLAWNETRHRRANRKELRKLTDELSAAEVDLIHALDGRLWPSTIELGQLLDVPVVLTANSTMDIEQARSLGHEIDFARTAITAATAPLGEMVRQVVGEQALVRTVPPGVHAGRDVAQALAPAQAGEEGELCVVVSGDGGLDEPMRQLLQGIHMALDDETEMQFFFDGQGIDQHKLWRTIEKLGLLRNSTLIPRRLGHREILLRANALVHPQALGKARSLTLRAMACGLPVISVADEALDYLQPETTARVLNDPTPEDWCQCLLWLARQRSEAAALGQRSHQWVREHRPVSAQIESLLHVYRSLTGETLPFPG